MVRLGAPGKTEKIRSPLVSIPKWCDWECPGKGELIAVFLVSIPKWCDWEKYYYYKRPHCEGVSIPKWCDWENVGVGGFTFYRKFQFLNGAIGRIVYRQNTLPLFLFQFLNGAIGR